MNKFVFCVLLMFCVTAINGSILVKRVNRITCSKISLKNGRVRYRQKTGFAQFQCNKSYLLAGEKYMKCVHGKWEGDIPKCVKNTCVPPRQPLEGFVFPSFRGAVLNFFCKAEYKLIGPAMIYCDDHKWSDQLPTCIASKSNASLNCDFEREDLCGWSHDLNHDFDWTRMQFGTPSGHIGTGPSHDHTSGSGFYMYIEASSRNVNDTARLISPMYKNQDTNTCLEFFYHMFGSAVGELRVYLKKAEDMWDLNPEKAVFRLAGNQGNYWRRGFVNLGTIEEDFQIVIEGIRGGYYTSDIAVDDVRIIEDCPEPDETVSTSESTTEDFTTESYEINSCTNRCNVPTEDEHCDCSPDCILSNSCCADYIAVCILTEDIDDNTTDETVAETISTEMPTVADNDYFARRDKGTKSGLAVTSQAPTETNDSSKGEEMGGHDEATDTPTTDNEETNAKTNNNENNDISGGNGDHGLDNNEDIVIDKNVRDKTSTPNIERHTIENKATTKVSDEKMTNDNRHKMAATQNGTQIIGNDGKIADALPNNNKSAVNINKTTTASPIDNKKSTVSNKNAVKKQADETTSVGSNDNNKTKIWTQSSNKNKNDVFIKKGTSNGNSITTNAKSSGPKKTIQPTNSVTSPNKNDVIETSVSRKNKPVKNISLPPSIQENNIFKNDMLTVPISATTPDWELVTEIARLLSEKSQPITKLHTGHPSVFTVFVLACLGLVGVAAAVCVARRRYVCVRFGGIRSRSYGDSQSDVRFLTNDEVLNFELACPDD